MNTVDYNPSTMDRSKYLKEKSFPQLREILTNYGTIDIIWFDMGKGLDNEEIREFVKITRELQPNIIISSRIGDEVAPTRICILTFSHPLIIILQETVCHSF